MIKRQKFIIKREVDHNYLENLQLGHEKNKKACLQEQNKGVAELPVTKKIRMTRREPGLWETDHTAMSEILEAASKIQWPKPRSVRRQNGFARWPQEPSTA